MSYEECLYTVVTNMLFVVHNVSYGRSVLKVGEKCFVIDMLMVSLPIFVFVSKQKMS